ncbi:MAG: glycosyltransferase family 39 protein [Bacteroidales bacterium]|nr:glycosyltransferase family 39 protein [Bacteroidales bacterium]
MSSIIQKIKNLEFYIPLIIGVYLLFAFRFNVFALPMSYSEIDFFSEYMKLADDGSLQLFSDRIPNIPILSYFLIFKIFGANITVVRITAAVFSIVLVFIVLKFGIFFFGKQAGIFAATILIVQNIYLAQFATIQPEVLNAIFLLSALYCFLREKYRTMAIWLTLSVNIDISGLLAILFMIVAFLVKLNNNQKSQSIVFFIIPLVAYATAETANYVAFEHLGILQNIGFEQFDKNIINNANFAFLAQQRMTLTLILIISILAAALQRQIEKYEVKTYIYITVFMLLIATVHALVNSDLCKMFPVVVLLAVATGAAISEIKMLYVYKYIIISVLILFFAVFDARSKNTSCEYISHTHQVETDWKATKFIKEKMSQNDTLICSNLFYKILSNKYLGYITENNINIDTIYSATKYSYVIKGKEPSPKNVSAVIIDEKCMLEKSFTKKEAETEIYSVEK